MWEDPANASGGKWILLFRTNGISNPSVTNVLDIAWANLAMALVGEMLDPEDQVCGVVASSRPKVDRVQIWTRSRDESTVEKLNGLGKRVVECLGLEGREVDSMSMEFQVSL
jgi:translation initiation factor 4E